jgi:hypothetical protein
LVVCEPQGGQNPSHPPDYWYDVTPGSSMGLFDFHVKAVDSVAGNYSNWVEPTGWTHTIHKVGTDWWISWWDPSGGSPIMSTFRFEFDHSGTSVWTHWVTTNGSVSDPTLGGVDSSANHTTDPDGYGYRVHVPQPPAVTPLDSVACEPQSGQNPTHPATFWYDVFPGGGTGRCDFHVEVFDSVAANYSNWVEPAGWTHALHKVGTKWYVSWWNPGCANAIFSSFRFQFDNSGTAVWGRWVTTTSGSNDPAANVMDSAEAHAGNPDGYGHWVHVPRLATTCCLVRGDVNHSGAVNVADISYLVDFLFRGGPAPPCLPEADVNGSGDANVSDLSYLVDYLFRGGPAPVPCP